MSKDVANIDVNLPAELQGQFGGASDDLISSTGGFPVLSIRGSKWRAKVSGEEHVLRDASTDDPLASVELVILAAQTGLSKNFYEHSYTEGDNEAPACFSVDGEKPDAQAEKPQAKTCATCPNAVWGSRITEAGKKGKACADSKRLAVSFATDLDNEAMGGPMLLRVPAASLKDLTQFARLLNAKNIDYRAIAIRMGFDTDVSYPKLTFKAAYALSTEQLQKCVELRGHDNVMNIMSGASSDAKPAQPPRPKAVDIEFDAAPAPQAAPVIAAKPAPVKEVKAEPKKKPAAKKTPPKPEEELGSILSDLEL